MPLFVPADHVTTALAFPAVADTPVGAPGTTLGMTAKEGDDDAEFPRIFLATTVKVTAVPFCRPVSVAVRTFSTVIAEPTEGVTTYAVIGEPPLKGAVQVTTAEEFPGVANTAVGTPGMVAGVTAIDGEDEAEFPTLFTALTVKVTAVPFASPVRVAVKTFPTVIAAPTEGVTI